jgi:hypothetical protein
MKVALTKEQRDEIAREVQRCIWFTPKEALSWALAAFYGACKDAQPPPGEPWAVEGCAWTNGGNFAEAFQRRLTDRLNREAEQLRIPSPDNSGALVGWDNPGQSGAGFDAPPECRLPHDKTPCNHASELEGAGAV